MALLPQFIKNIFTSSDSSDDHSVVNFTVKNSQFNDMDDINRISKNNTINSSIMFEFDTDMKITVKTSVNDELIPVLIKDGYIDEENSTDSTALQLCLIMLANESSEQIILGINDEES